MSAHTPGPWFLWENTAGDGRWFIASGPEGEPRSHVVVSPDDGWDSGYTDFEERHANARLIAVAPELLAELQNIANADPSKWEPDVRDQFRQWAQNRARVVIAKAEGRS